MTCKTLNQNRLLLRIRSGRVVTPAPPPEPKLTVEDVRAIGTSKLTASESLLRVLLLQNALDFIVDKPGSECFRDPAMAAPCAPGSALRQHVPRARKQLILSAASSSLRLSQASSNNNSISGGAGGLSRPPLSSCVVLGGSDELKLGASTAVADAVADADADADATAPAASNGSLTSHAEFLASWYDSPLFHPGALAVGGLPEQPLHDVDPMLACLTTDAGDSLLRVPDVLSAGTNCVRKRPLSPEETAEIMVASSCAEPPRKAPKLDVTSTPKCQPQMDDACNNNHDNNKLRSPTHSRDVLLSLFASYPDRPLDLLVS